MIFSSHARRLIVALILGGAALLPSALAQGGTATIALPGEAQTLDMQITTAEVAGSISSHWLETLVAFDSTWAPQPHLAQSIDVSDDGLTYTFALRQGVPFHNGQEMVAADVVASLSRWMNVSPRGKNVQPYVVDLSATDTYTVSLSLSAPFAPLLSLLAHHSGGAGIYPASVVEAAGTEPIQEHIGTGPYRFVQWLPDRYVEVARFDDYAGLDTPSDGYSGARVAHFDTIRFATVPEVATRIAGTQTGEYDYAWQVSPDSYAMLEMDPSVDVVIRKPFIWPVIFFNKKEGMMTNQTMRQAINAALDNEELLLAGAGIPEFMSLDHNYMVGDTPFNTDAGLDQYNQADPDRARALAAEAGYMGEPIKWLTSPDYNQHYQMSLAAQQQLEEAGFTVEMIAVEWGTLLDLRAQPDKWDVFVTHHGFAPDPVLINTLSPTYPGWWDEPTRDELVGTLHTSTTLEARQAAWEALMEYNWTYLPSIIVGEWYGLAVKSPNLELGDAALQGMPAYWNSRRAE